ncbi:peptidase inhibitor family I36 protein [Streptomyces platensis]|uniref:peptidase inhibitor family I36 protein n=2 Tax=Streptomyces TaxID=1883 RepID=UPI0038673CEF|nr:peptidase inhibitor family I36 protein [Streptomyces platensis]
MKKTLVAGAIAAACVTATTIGLGATPASADPNDCPKKYVCVWDESNYEGRFVFVPGTERPNVGEYMNDRTTALRNRTGSQVCFYQNSDGKGSLLARVAPGDSRPNIGSTANDRISSWKAC